MFLTLGLDLKVQVFVTDSAFQGFGLKLCWFGCVLLNPLHVLLVNFLCEPFLLVQYPLTDDGLHLGRLWLDFLLSLVGFVFPVQSDEEIFIFSTDDSPAVLGSALALLTLVRVKQREIVIVADFFTRQNIFQSKKSHPWQSSDCPFLHFTVGGAGVVNKPALRARPVGINHDLVVHGEAVVVVVPLVPRQHPPLKLPGAADLARVLQDEAVLGDALPGSHAPALLGRHEPLQPGGVELPLDHHVGALDAIHAGPGLALRVSGSVNAARPAGRLSLLWLLAVADVRLVVPQPVPLPDVYKMSRLNCIE